MMWSWTLGFAPKLQQVLHSVSSLQNSPVSGLYLTKMSWNWIFYFQKSYGLFMLLEDRIWTPWVIIISVREGFDCSVLINCPQEREVRFMQSSEEIWPCQSARAFLCYCYVLSLPWTAVVNDGTMCGPALCGEHCVAGGPGRAWGAKLHW